ncbi:uncharacterized protein ASPGLDRAFT_135390 [Aspergillus glaucus CBS 516.65]|uniref:Uncharacterized protein n=1 Tax=Aspergillus glaucus CBS 516.65 TaxID=1160497 RepID=A0A1L9V8C9_ASPGL|nr:hypothetical protein ASPGLDRAFT_135390 [Aspergillus glaucus CBS 516.65]OJJ80188.1 hypothetical protein ASPGLDRAFT_135390 [Aspergillus glaucus CBS 516.65]
MATGNLIFYHNKKDVIEAVSHPATIAERTRCRRQLDHSLPTPEDLKERHIRHERMPLEEESKPLYLTPYEATIENTNNQRLVNWYPKLEADDDHYSCASFLTWYLREYFLSYNLPKGDLIPSGSRYRGLELLGFGMLSTVSGSPEESWQVETAWDTRQRGHPHMKVLIASGVCPDDKLSKAEVAVIHDVMHRRLRTMHLCNHKVSPVLLFSVVPMNHIRVIEAFYDGKELVVRSTKNHDIEHRDLDLIIRLSRWWVGYPSQKDTRGFAPAALEEILAARGLV